MTSHRLRPCPDCGAPRSGGACGRCGWAGASKVSGVRADLARPEWRRRSETELASWRAVHGDWCPGWPPSGHRPHPDRHLALHHHTDDPDGPASVLCRIENGRLGAPGRDDTARR
jgi:5-methylcytosine-specific restriction protein A